MTKTINDEFIDYVTFDVECYQNYVLFMFRKISDGQVIYYEMFNDSDLNINGLKHVLNKYTLITFNGVAYDSLIISAAIAGLTNEQIHNVSTFIIESDLQPWQVLRQFGFRLYPFDQIDLIEVAPLSASLKIYAGRLHVKVMQDLPIEPDAKINAFDLEGMRKYCEYDNIDTCDLFIELQDQIKLRCDMSTEYKVDVRSKSDAQVAEAVYKTEMLDKYKVKVKKATMKTGTLLKYTLPNFITVHSDKLKKVISDIENLDFRIQKSGHVFMPPILTDGHLVIGDYVCEVPINKKPELNTWDLEIKKVGACYRAFHLDGEPITLAEGSTNVTFKSKNVKTGKVTNKRFKKINSNKVIINKTEYTIGLGGLHSTESNRYIDARNESFKLKDYDVVSYYPFIILILGLFPKGMGKFFLKVFKSIVFRRLSAKAAGLAKVSGTLKILINGTFGKLGSAFSFLYAPQLMLQVTITGQLLLLMLIEALEGKGVQVVSANTDGVILKIEDGQQPTVDAIILDWELETGFDMESTEYEAVYSQHVNSYLALCPDMKFKKKGAMADPSLSLNPQNQICVDAVCAYIAHGTPFIDTIEACKDVRRFVTVRKVTGGAIYEGEYVGKAVRWYYSDESLSALHYKKSGNKVPKSDGARPLMVLPDDNAIPYDIDYNWYVVESETILNSMGATL